MILRVPDSMPSNRLGGASRPRPPSVHWPLGHEPAGAAINEVNTGRSSASPEAVWAWLVRPDRWKEYYGNARRVRALSGPWPEVELGTVISWLTFGAPVRTEITEFEPFERLAWTGSGLGSRGHHAWVLTARGDGGTTSTPTRPARDRLEAAQSGARTGDATSGRLP